MVVRSRTVAPDGGYSLVVGPSGNPRLSARTVTSTGSSDSEQKVLAVTTSLNLKVVRTSTRTLRFTGSLLSRRPGQSITIFFETADGSRVIAARARIAADRTFDVSRAFSTGGSMTRFAATGTDDGNAADDSNRGRWLSRRQADGGPRRPRPGRCWWASAVAARPGARPSTPTRPGAVSGRHTG